MPLKNTKPKWKKSKDGEINIYEYKFFLSKDHYYLGVIECCELNYCADIYIQDEIFSFKGKSFTTIEDAKDWIVNEINKRLIK